MEMPLPSPRTELNDVSLVTPRLAERLYNDRPNDKAYTANEASRYPAEGDELEEFDAHAASAHLP